MHPVPAQAVRCRLYAIMQLFAPHGRNRNNRRDGNRTAARMATIRGSNAARSFLSVKAVFPLLRPTLGRSPSGQQQTGGREPSLDAPGRLFRGTTTSIVVWTVPARLEWEGGGSGVVGCLRRLKYTASMPDVRKEGQQWGGQPGGTQSSCSLSAHELMQ